MKKFILLLSLLLISNICFVFAEPKAIPAGKVIVYPNPWIPEANVTYTSSKDTTYHGHLSADGWIKFAGMQKDTGELRIYDINGNLVKHMYWNAETEQNNFPVTHYDVDGDVTQEWIDRDKDNPSSTNYIKIIHWDGKNDKYEYVESGVYIWILQEDGGKKHNGKLVVVR